MESSFKERLKYFEITLKEKQDEYNSNDQWSSIIDMKSFREACFHGIPEDSTIHATAWKVLLGYLPPDKNMWQKTIYDQRLSYYNLVKDLLERPTEEPPSNDHPLNVTPGSKWASYIHDNTILEQIDKDVKRTLPDFAFFQQHVPQNPLNPLSAPLPPTSISTTSTTITIDNQQNSQSYDPLDDDDFLDPLQANDVKRRFSFGIMGRPRSGSNASRKSIKNNNSNSNSNNNNNSNNIVNRSRSNSKSSTRSFSTGMIENGADIIQSPRNLVRKISTAFSKSNSSLSLNTFATKKYQHHPQQQQKPALKPMCPYIPNRRSLFKRIQQQLNHDDNHHASSTNTNGKKENDKDDDDDDHVQDYHWEVIERILFMYAKLNPGIGYVQGMNEILAPIYYVFANDTSTHLAGQVHAEADTFFSFSILMGEVRDHFVRSLDQDATTGIHATLLRMQQRLAWYDKSLWRDLQRKDIKEAYYAFRWITVLFTQEWDLPDVIRLWDSLLAERGMQDTILNNNNNMNQHHYGQSSIPPSTSFVNETPFEFLLDFSVAMLVCIRQELFKGDFAENVKLLQNYPINDIQYVLNTAYQIRELRLQTIAIGHMVPGINNVRHSGVLNSDWSDTSSISSTTSTASTRLQQKLRESTELARASFDSFKRDSKESMDDIFRRGIVASSEQWKRASTGDMKRSISQRLGFVKNNMMAKAKRSGSVRSTTSENNHSSLLSTSPSSPRQHQQQQHWLLANQFNNNSNSNSHSPSSEMQRSQSDRHQRATSGSSQLSIDSTLSSKSANVFNRFSQMVISNNHHQPSTSSNATPFHYYDNPSNPLMSASHANHHHHQEHQQQSHEEENEKLIFAKAEEARYQALHYRTSTAYKGCV